MLRLSFGAAFFVGEELNGNIRCLPGLLELSDVRKKWIFLHLHTFKSLLSRENWSFRLKKHDLV